MGTGMRKWMSRERRSRNKGDFCLNECFSKGLTDFKRPFIEAAPFSWRCRGALLLAGSAVFLQGFHVPRSHNIYNVQKPASLGVCQGKFNAEKRGGMDECQVVQGVWTKWLEAKQERHAVVFSGATNTHHNSQAACSALSDTCKFIPGWKHRDPWSRRGCKLQ